MKPLQLDMMELEILALTSKDVLQDVHLAKAVEIFKKSPDQISPNMRRMAKTFNYMEIYGGSSVKNLPRS
jgi:DNA polymerase I-like protein with 3'-5' exonuclease and polymerase domains